MSRTPPPPPFKPANREPLALTREEVALQMRKALVDLIHQNTRLKSESEYADLGPTFQAARALEEFDKRGNGMKIHEVYLINSPNGYMSDSSGRIFEFFSYNAADAQLALIGRDGCWIEALLIP